MLLKTINYLSKICSIGILLFSSIPVIASPNNFNHGLRLNNEKKEPTTNNEKIIIVNNKPEENLPEKEPNKTRETPKQRESVTETSSNNVPKIIFESTDNDSLRNIDNQGQINQYTHQTVTMKLQNGDRLSVTSGYENYQQTGIKDVNNIPVELNWQSSRGGVNLGAGIKVDFFDRLTTGYGFNTSISGEVSPGLTLSGIVEQGPYKFNAQTLENEITAWRYGPNAYWQISKDISLFSLFRVGNYSDGNVENQSFTRIEKKFGQFAVAANLFTWGYSQDLNTKNGYFSPSDFLVYTGELSWTGEIFADLLKCRLAVAIGEQRVEGSPSGADIYEGLCSIKFSPNLSADLGYSYSNVRSTGSDANFSMEKFIGKFRWNF